MVEKIVTISNRAGVHMRPAGMIVAAIKDFTCTILFEKDRNTINAKSIMGIITLKASYGTNLKIIADGEGEQAAIDTLVHLFESKFEEE